MLPYEPESIESAKARLGDALRDRYDFEAPGFVVPAKRRKHIFDFEDGLRLIISVDKLGGSFETHVSASLWPNFKFQTPGPCGPAHLDELIKRVQERWREMGKSTRLEFHGLSEGKGVPHFHEVLVN